MAATDEGTTQRICNIHRGADQRRVAGRISKRRRHLDDVGRRLRLSPWKAAQGMICAFRVKEGMAAALGAFPARRYQIDRMESVDVRKLDIKGRARRDDGGRGRPPR